MGIKRYVSSFDLSPSISHIESGHVTNILQPPVSDKRRAANRQEKEKKKKSKERKRKAEEEAAAEPNAKSKSRPFACPSPLNHTYTVIVPLSFGIIIRQCTVVNR